MRGTHQGQQSPRTASTGRTHDCKRPLRHAPHDLLQGRWKRNDVLPLHARLGNLENNDPSLIEPISSL